MPIPRGWKSAIRAFADDGSAEADADPREEAGAMLPAENAGLEDVPGDDVAAVHPGPVVVYTTFRVHPPELS